MKDVALGRVEVIESKVLKSTAVLFLIFNRPDTTQAVFEKIRKARPPRLYVAADGPRQGRLQEIILVNEARAIIDAVDWPCDVYTLFRESNKGCKNAVSEAITWFFQSEDRGIILEDDCLPEDDFFPFMENLLDRYLNDMRVWHVGGFCALPQKFINQLDPSSYYFSNFNHIWGWGTWKNRWEHYDVKLKKLPDFISGDYIKSIFAEKSLQKMWVKCFTAAYKNLVDTWDYQWYFTVWSNGGRGIIPTSNLVKNIGFGEGATHTLDSETHLARIPSAGIKKIIHPEIFTINGEYDHLNAQELFSHRGLSLLNRKTRSLIRKIKSQL